MPRRYDRPIIADDLNPMHARRSRTVRAWRKVKRIVRQALIGWS